MTHDGHTVSLTSSLTSDLAGGRLAALDAENARLRAALEGIAQAEPEWVRYRDEAGPYARDCEGCERLIAAARAALESASGREPG